MIATVAQPLRRVPAGRSPVIYTSDYMRQRFKVRFDAYRATRPTLPLQDVVQGFVSSLPASQQSNAKTALKLHHLGRMALDWEGIRTKRYHRDELNLHASVLRPDDRQRLRLTIDQPRDLALIECLWVLRRAEAAALIWACVDLGQGVIQVRRGKGGKSAVAILPQSTQEALAAWFQAAGEPPDETPVFPVPPTGAKPKYYGKPYSPGGLGALVARILEKAGLWKSGAGAAHRFRRSFATAYMKANDGDLRGLQAMLRHESIATTAKYVFLTTDDLAPRLNRVRL